MKLDACSVRFSPCAFEAIRAHVASYYAENRIVVDSFWETHVRTSRFYTMEHGGEVIGYFAIHNGTLLMLFNVFEERYRYLSQELFRRVTRYESVMQALIPTGDEFFLSHAIDAFAKMEKQAYFSLYTDREPETKLDLELHAADIERDVEILKLSGDFLDGEVENIRNGIPEELYIATFGGEVVGFGVVEYGRIVERYASIGMYVREEHRRKGIAANILQCLKEIVSEKGRTAVSGCWYYNHNSKKSMESAGAFSKTRLLRFFF